MKHFLKIQVGYCKVFFFYKRTKFLTVTSLKSAILNSDSNATKNAKKHTKTTILVSTLTHRLC